MCRHCRCLFWKSIGHPCIGNEANTRKAGQSVAKTNKVSQQQDGLPRPSVALLSRNFDGRARAEGAENVPPRSQPLRANSGGGSALRDRLQERLAGGLRLQNPPNRRDQHVQPLVEGDVHAQARRSNREELVPTHITITPQAFLKFFSL